MSVNLTVLAESLPGLEVELSRLSKVFSDLESFAERGRSGEIDDADGHANVWDTELFEFRLERLALFIRVTLEAADLPLAREDFQKGWDAFTDLNELSWQGEIDALISKPFEFLQNALDAIRVLTSRGRSPIELADAKRLRDILESTAYLLHRRGVVPKKEKEIQDVMDDYLSACFLGDYSQKPQLSGFIKNFNADGGVKSLGTAIEFKFVTSDIEMKQALSGIVEDTAGYRGSKDWTTFYSVVYQTAPFASGAHFRAELKRVGGLQWTAIVVGGEGSKAPKRAKAQPPK